tara:strand:- start:14571 stop:16856 length:2286 start_codon:yes stop_codon:yes gene_type:complete
LISKTANDLSIVIPYNGELAEIKKLINKINISILIPKEIIIVSSKEDEKFEYTISQIINKSINLKIIFNIKSFPGKSRNIGILESSCENILFLDTKTFPDTNWLNINYKKFIKNNYDVLIGATKYIYKNFFEKINTAAINGEKILKTIPGSFFKKKAFENIGLFNPTVRAGEDLEFKERIYKSNLNYSFSTYFLRYEYINSNIFSLGKKYFIYAYHNAYIDCLLYQKYLYMFILTFLLFLTSFTNEIIFFFSNFANIKLLLVIIIAVIIIPNIFLLFKQFTKRKYLSFFLNFTIISLLSLLIYKWNLISTFYFYFYIPNITKIYLLSLFIVSLLYRGLYNPYKNGVDKKFIKKYFILIGLNGLILDLCKVPGLIFGYLILPILNFKYSNILIFPYIFNKIHKAPEKKVLFVCPFPYNIQAGQRLKFEQSYPYLAENNVHIYFSSFINNETYKIIYRKGYFITKLYSLIIGYIKRLTLIYYLKKFDSVYIFMWVTPFGPPILEKIYRLFSKKITYDIEDNLLINKKNEINPLTFVFKSNNKIKFLINSSDKIIASSPELSKNCNQISNSNKTIFIPPGINLQRYKVSNPYSNKNLVTIGWTGSTGSKEYLTLLENILIKLSKTIRFKFIVISDFKYSIKGVNVESIIWNKENEISDLSKIDIGLYPLNLSDSKFVSGKSGLKALQYMAMGLPTIATGIGNTVNIIDHMENGILVKETSDWEKYIKLMIDDPDLRRKIGLKGRQTIENNYSLDKIKKMYLSKI